MSFLCSETLSYSRITVLHSTGAPSISKGRKGGKGVETGRKKENKGLKVVSLFQIIIEFLSRITQVKQIILHTYHFSRSNEKVRNRFSLGE